MLMFTLVGCESGDKQEEQQNSTVENKVETEETEKKDNNEHIDREFRYGTYSDGNFSLLKYCVGGVFYELEEGEVIYYFATEEIGYDKIPQEFYESVNK